MKMFDSCGKNNAKKAHEAYAKDPDARAVHKQRGKNLTAGHDATKFKLSSVRKWFVHAFIDVSGNVKRKLLDEFGLMGKRIVTTHDLILGATAEGKRVVHRAQREIFSKFTFDEYLEFAGFIESRRIIALYKNRNRVKDELLNPGGLTAAQHQRTLDVLKESNPVFFRELNKAADQYFKIMEEQLVKLREAGLITEDAFEAMKSVGDYSPRRYIKFIDKEVAGFSSGNKISVMDSGLKKLDKGSTDALESDPRLLMADVAMRTENRIARNNANKELWKLAGTNNPLVRRVKIGTKISHNEEEIYVMINGKRRRMAMDSEYAKEWLVRDPILNHSDSKILQWASGAPVLRAFATGLNPEFALTNLPRDIFHAWFSADGEYHPYVWMGGAQMAKDLAVVAKDVMSFKDVASLGKNPTGRVLKYIQQGGMMDFLTDYGRGIQYEADDFGFVGVKSKAGKVKREALHVLQTKGGALLDMMAVIGQKSELWTRIAVRERAINNRVAQFKKDNKRKPEPDELEQIEIEATWVARNFLDFSQGGSYAKAIDKFVPYFNASIQGTRGVARQLNKITFNRKNATREQKAVVWKKVTSLFTFAMILQLLNRTFNDDEMDKISEYDRRSSWILPFPVPKENADGTTSWVFKKVAKDQMQRGLAAIAEGIVDLSMGKKVNPDLIVDSVKEAFPILPGQGFLPPSFKFLIGVSQNHDFWRKGPIWNTNYSGGEITADQEFYKNHKFYPNTHPAYVKLAEELKERFDIEVSPEKTRYAMAQYFAPTNTFVAATGNAFRNMMEDSNPKQTVREMSRSTAFGRRMETVTQDSNIIEVNEMHDMKVEETTKNFNANRAVAGWGNKYSAAETEGEKKEIARQAVKSIKGMDISASEKKKKLRKMVKYIENERKMGGPVPEGRLWTELRGFPNSEAKARGLYFHAKDMPFDKQRDLMKIAIKMGLVNDDFVSEYVRLLNEEKESSAKLKDEGDN